LRLSLRNCNRLRNEKAKAVHPVDDAENDAELPEDSVSKPQTQSLQERGQLWEDAFRSHLFKSGELMQLTPQITFRGISSSEAIDNRLRKQIEKLEKYYDRIMGCRVMVETSHRRHHGNLYHIRIDLTVPGGELVVNRTPPEHQEHEDIYTAIRDAFGTAERELKEYAQRQRGDIKTHAGSLDQRLASLSPDEDNDFRV
jgi:ribosomal subunit interface protein